MRYNQKILDEIASDLEKYLDIIDRYLVIEGISEEDYKKSRKHIRKAIKKLRKGDGDKVLREDKYEEYITGRIGRNNDE